MYIDLNGLKSVISLKATKYHTTTGGAGAAVIILRAGGFPRLSRLPPPP